MKIDGRKINYLLNLSTILSTAANQSKINSLRKIKTVSKAPIKLSNQKIMDFNIEFYCNIEKEFYALVLNFSPNTKFNKCHLVMANTVKELCHYMENVKEYRIKKEEISSVFEEDILRKRMTAGLEQKLRFVQPINSKNSTRVL